MISANLKLIEKTTLINFDSHPINDFYDIISDSLPSWDKKYYLYVESLDYNGIKYGEWIVFDVTNMNLFTAIEELHLHLINSTNKHSIFNNDLVSTIIFEDDKDCVNDDTIKHISITYYEDL